MDAPSSLPHLSLPPSGPFGIGKMRCWTSGPNFLFGLAGCYRLYRVINPRENLVNVPQVPNDVTRMLMTDTVSISEINDTLNTK